MSVEIVISMRVAVIVRVAMAGGDDDGRGHLDRENDPDDGGDDDSRARLCLDNAAPREPRPDRRSAHRRPLPARDKAAPARCTAMRTRSPRQANILQPYAPRLRSVRAKTHAAQSHANPQDMRQLKFSRDQVPGHGTRQGPQQQPRAIKIIPRPSCLRRYQLRKRIARRCLSIGL